MTEEAVAGLPPGGPATVSGAKTQVGIEDDDDNARFAAIVAAVNAKVRAWPCTQIAAGAEDWDGEDLQHLVLGANMLAGRLYRRKNSPAGVEAFGADGAVYVRRSDPDIAQLLNLGEWALPGVG